MAKRNTRRERRTFTDEYKQHVLKLVRVGEKSISQICRELDLIQSAVHNWIRAEQQASGTMTQNCVTESDQQEL